MQYNNFPYIHRTGGAGTLKQRVCLDYQQRMFLSSILRTYWMERLEPGSGDAEFVEALIMKVEGN